MWVELTNKATGDKMAVNFDHVRRFGPIFDKGTDLRNGTEIIYCEDDNPRTDPAYTLTVEEPYDTVWSGILNAITYGGATRA